MTRTCVHNFSLERDKSVRDATTETDPQGGGLSGPGGVEYSAHSKVVEENAVLSKQLSETQVRGSLGRSWRLSP